MVLDYTCVVPQYNDGLKTVKIIKVMSTLTVSTCELVDEYFNSPVSDVQVKNYSKFKNFYLRQNISFTTKMKLETGAILPSMAVIRNVPSSYLHRERKRWF